jgi:hypothetical protein
MWQTVTETQSIFVKTMLFGVMLSFESSFLASNSIWHTSCLLENSAGDAP